MLNKSLMLASLLVAASAHAEISSCNVGGDARFTIIELNTEAKTALITDRFERKVDGQITLVREQKKGANTYNISFEYTLNNTPTHFDMIIVPAGGETYRIGVAGYSNYGNLGKKNSSKPVLEMTSNDEALCY